MRPRRVRSCNRCVTCNEAPLFSNKLQKQQRDFVLSHNGCPPWRGHIGEAASAMMVFVVDVDCGVQGRDVEGRIALLVIDGHLRNMLCAM